MASMALPQPSIVPPHMQEDLTQDDLSLGLALLLRDLASHTDSPRPSMRSVKKSIMRGGAPLRSPPRMSATNTRGTSTSEGTQKAQQ